MLSTPPAFNLSQNQTLQLIEKQLACPYLYELKLKVSYSQLALHLSKNQRPLPQPLRFRQRRSGNLPRPVQLVNNFFFRTPKFFSERAARISPRRRSGNLSRPPLAVNRFLLLFSKNLFAPPSRPLGPARLSETFRPAAARTVYAPPRRLCQRLFIFFLIFLPHTPRFYRVFAPVRIQIFLKRF